MLCYVIMMHHVIFLYINTYYIVCYINRKDVELLGLRISRDDGPESLESLEALLEDAALPWPKNGLGRRRIACLPCFWVTDLVTFGYPTPPKARVANR